MKKELFDELLKSVKQGGAIMKRAMKPSRTVTFIWISGSDRVNHPSQR
jgi:hypothetical protein